MTKPILGFVGLGRMGNNMAARLIAAGYELVAFDTDAHALDSLVINGAKPAASPKSVADAVDIVLLSLPTPDIVQAVVLGENGVARGVRAKTIIDVSTTGPSMVERIVKDLNGLGISWVEAPVSGGIKGAREGSLAVIVGAKKTVLDEVIPILEHLGKIFYVGEKPGLAQVAKLGNNLLAAAAMVVSSEVMVMGAKAGINAQTMLDIINAGTGRNSATQDKFPKAVLTRTFDFGFATGLSYKDVRLCVDEAEAMGVPMVAGAVIRQMLAVTQAKYGAASDFTSIAKLIEEWAGVEVRG